MSKALGITLAVVGVLVVVVLMVFGSYVSAKNQMVAKDQNVKATWSEVDVQLEQRADLIPNLVETVKGLRRRKHRIRRHLRMRAHRHAERTGTSGEDCCKRTTGCAWASLLLRRKIRTAPSDQHALQDELSKKTAYSVAPQAVQRRVAGLQHIYPAVPEQHLGGDGWILAEHGVLHGESRGATGSQREVLAWNVAPVSRPAVLAASKPPGFFLGVLLNRLKSERVWRHGAAFKAHKKGHSARRTGLSLSGNGRTELRAYLKEAMALASSSWMSSKRNRSAGADREPSSMASAVSRWLPGFSPWCRRSPAHPSRSCRCNSRLPG